MISYVLMLMDICLEATRLVKIRCKMKYTLTFLLIIFLLPLVNAESTFFDQDDAFIMGSSTSGGTSGGIGGGGSCLTNWTCSNWSFCNNGMQIRNCTKEKAYCYADLNKKPIESQNCFVDKSGDKNNPGSDEGINNYPNGNESSIDNLNSSSSNIKTIILGILIIVAIFTLIFFGYKRYRKRRHFHYGY